MKICQVGTGLISINPNNKRVGAIENVIFNLSNSLTKLGNEVRIYDIEDSSRPQPIEGVYIQEIHQLTKRSDILKTIYFSLSSKMQLTFSNKKKYFDILHTHLGLPSILHSIPKNVPTIFTLHNKKWFIDPGKWTLKDTLQIKSDIAAMKLATGVIALNSNAKDVFVKVSGVSEDKVYVIPNGVNTELFSPDLPGSTYNTDLSIICVGRIDPLKNQNAIIKALSLVVKEIPNFHVTFIGPVEDYSYYKEMLATIRKFDIQKSVTFLKDLSTEEVIKHINSSTLFVFPSYTEVFSLALLEAMSCGRAIIASSIPQNKGIVKYGNEVIFVPPSDINALSREMIKLLNDKDLRKKLGRNARKTVLEFYDWNIIAKQTLKLYQKISNIYGE